MASNVISNAAWRRLLHRAGKALRDRVKRDGNSGRAQLVGGPCGGTCCVLEIGGVDVRDIGTLKFRHAGEIAMAEPCRDGEHAYSQRRRDDGSPATNLVGDILYDWVRPRETEV